MFNTMRNDFVPSCPIMQYKKRKMRDTKSANHEIRELMTRMSSEICHAEHKTTTQ